MSRQPGNGTRQKRSSVVCRRTEFRFRLVLIYPNMWHCHDVHLLESKPPDTCQASLPRAAPMHRSGQGPPTSDPAPSRLAREALLAVPLWRGWPSAGG